MVTTKDIAYLIVGLILGLVLGVGIYWWPLRQFWNEWRAIWNLNIKKYSRGDEIVVKAGTDLKSIVPTYGLAVTRDMKMRVWHDEGVGWYHTGAGWKRARVLNVFKEDDPNQLVYRVSHLEIED